MSLKRNFLFASLWIMDEIIFQKAYTISNFLFQVVFKNLQLNHEMKDKKM